MTLQKRSKETLAKIIAADIPEGAYVNLGIGMPTLIADHIDPTIEVILHSENGMLGMGPAPAAGDEDYDLTNAGKQAVSLVAGGSFFHHADSFAMIRGGHIDICVMGAYQVSVTGDLANWHTGDKDAIPAVGGAMDLAVGAKQSWVMMDLFTKNGTCKIVPKCSYPLTGVGCIKRVYTDYGTFDLDKSGKVKLRDVVAGITATELSGLMGVDLVV
ncbi:MAG: 3-oxoacid CoA-transferase subunit B [Alphaproteobacteria bacterium]|nr:3-oxoacid CoA-transferase subunit B [Alphaproteobacteria bacterium]